MNKKLVNEIAIFEILKLCAVGYSNYRIAHRLRFNMNYVEQCLLDYLHFNGWNTDLDFSPLALYNRNNDFQSYRQEIYIISPVSERVITLSYNIIKGFKKIEKEIENYYGNTTT